MSRFWRLLKTFDLDSSHKRPTPQFSSNYEAGLNELAKSRRRDEVGESAPTAQPLKRVKREPMDS